MPNIEPPCPPKPGDLIEVEHKGKWQHANIVEVKHDRIFGFVTGTEIGFSYTITSYRRNWKFR